MNSIAQAMKLSTVNIVFMTDFVLPFVNSITI